MVHTLESPANRDVVLELDGDLLIDQSLEEAVVLSVKTLSSVKIHTDLKNNIVLRLASQSGLRRQAIALWMILEDGTRLSFMWQLPRAQRRQPASGWTDCTIGLAGV